jgi:transposase-like protein
VSRKVARRAKTRKGRRIGRAERRERQGRTQTLIDTAIGDLVRTAIEGALAEEVTALLGRGRRERRALSDETEVAACCNRCGTQRRSRFYRAGTYRRSLLTFETWTELRVPRVSCVCGGMVDVEFVHLVPYGRRWFDIEERARELAALCVSLRDTVQVLAWRNGQPLALTTANQVVNETARLHQAWAAAPFERVPAVVLLDGLWLKVLEPTGATFVDRAGRERQRQRKRTWPILVAYGVDPVSGERWLLDWERGEAEDAASWQRFLERLEGRGLVAERGLELIVHDGGSGLAAALTTVYFGPDVDLQRCVFHKLRNVRQAVRGDETMGRKERRQRRKAVLADARAIYQHDTAAACWQALAAFREKWAAAEPEAVATLERDFTQTLTYLRVRDRALARGRLYRLECLRTTSPLERVNRHFRRKARQVVIFHAAAGVTAALELVIAHRHLTPATADTWTQQLEGTLAAA